MKQTVQMDTIQHAMQPGVLTLEGFLGADTRKLVDILINDDAEVKRLGLSHQQIAMKMIEFRDAGMKGLGEFISVPPHFEVRTESVRGKIPCPFGDPGIFPKSNTTVRNLKLNKEVTFTELNIHMIYAHGFYEGHGSNFRINPHEIVELLEIEPIQ